MAIVDYELQRLSADAQRSANRDGAPCAIYNLNSAGRRLLVIRSCEAGAPAPYAGPFEPKPIWQTEFPDYPAEYIPALGDGWRDESWHNEAGPRFVHAESGLVIWCLDPAPDCRELEGDALFSVVQIAENHPLHGWQFGESDREVLHCDTLGELRDWLDSVPYCATMADSLVSARMRLNQLTPADARELLANELRFSGKRCPDLIGGMLELIYAAPGAMLLDGEPARLRFKDSRFVLICRADGRGGDVEFSTRAAAYVLANGGGFQS